MAWTYSIAERDILVGKTKCLITATISLDGNRWARRELVLDLAALEGQTPEQVKALIDAEVASAIKSDGVDQVDLKTRLAALVADQEVSQAAIDNAEVKG